MKVQRCQSASFGAKSLITGFSDATKAKLETQLSAMGDDNFSHYLNKIGDTISTLSIHESDKGPETIRGPIQFLMGKGESESNVVDALIRIAKEKVEYFQGLSKEFRD